MRARPSGSRLYDLSDAHLDLARLLLEHGADVNRAPNVNSFDSFHLCAIFPGDRRRKFLLELFLENGGNVNPNRIRHKPLELLLRNCAWTNDLAARLCLDSVRCLLRAGALLDIDQNGRDCAQRSMNDAPLSERELSSHFYACKALISDYRAAGSTWKGYVRAPPKELLRLRSLIARGRARERRRLRAATPREIAFLFAPAFPNELFWKVATYWNPRYEALTPNSN